ncbi:MAG: zinc dependent phospholipase C family protein [Clostridia bacterium]|jgi:hypothetical protein|nr:zinc dependent phospholipase C family protein [Clostridia bacterium]
MPNAWTHLLLGEEMLKSVFYDYPEDILPLESVPCFQIGCQGPDFFLYHHWEHVFLASRYDVSSRLHREKCHEFLIWGIKRVKKLKNKGESYEKLAAYVLGVLAHFLVDNTVHPLVYSLVSPIKSIGQNKHTRLEIELDMLVYKEFEAADVFADVVRKERQSIYQILRLPYPIPNEIIEFYREGIAEIWQGKLLPPSGENIKAAYRDYLRFYKMTDKKGLMYGISKAIGFLSWGNRRLDWYWYPVNPSVGVTEIVKDGGFWELCQEAITKGEVLFPLICKYWQGRDNLDLIISLLPEGNYLGYSEQ